MLFLLWKPFSAALLSLVLLFALITPGCFDRGPLSKLDSTLDYAPLFFRGLVISDVITDEQATKYQAGVTQFEALADETKTCVSDAGTNEQKFACYLTLGNKSRSIIAQFYPDINTGSNSKVAQYVLLVKDVVELIIKKNTPQVGQAGPSPVDLDKQLDNKIDELNDLLKSEAR
jgi:hypothetical protein